MSLCYSSGEESTGGCKKEMRLSKAVSLGRHRGWGPTPRMWAQMPRGRSICVKKITSLFPMTFNSVLYWETCLLGAVSVVNG